MSIATDPNKALLTRAQAYDAVAFAPPTVANIGQLLMPRPMPFTRISLVM